MRMEYPKRKMPRHPIYDYNTPGYYFITLCTKEKAKILGEIVGRSLPDAPDTTTLQQRSILEAAPYIQYSKYGETACRQLDHMASFYKEITLEKYVVMPNHIHMILHINRIISHENDDKLRRNALVSRFVGTFKRFCNKQYGQNIWQTSFHDHVIRNEKDYLKIWEYIENNPLKWTLDCFYGDQP